MAISETENEWLQGFFDAYDGREKEVSDWARGFISDQIDRYKQYGSDIRLSPKQWAALKRSAGDIGYDGPSADGGNSRQSDDEEIPF